MTTAAAVVVPPPAALPSSGTTKPPSTFLGHRLTRLWRSRSSVRRPRRCGHRAKSFNNRQKKNPLLRHSDDRYDYDDDSTTQPYWGGPSSSVASSSLNDQPHHLPYDDNDQDEEEAAAAAVAPATIHLVVTTEEKEEAAATPLGGANDCNDAQKDGGAVAVGTPHDHHHRYINRNRDDIMDDEEVQADEESVSLLTFETRRTVPRPTTASQEEGWYTEVLTAMGGVVDAQLRVMEKSWQCTGTDGCGGGMNFRRRHRDAYDEYDGLETVEYTVDDTLTTRRDQEEEDQAEPSVLVDDQAPRMLPLISTPSTGTMVVSNAHEPSEVLVVEDLSSSLAADRIGSEAQAKRIVEDEGDDDGTTETKTLPSLGASKTSARLQKVYDLLAIEMERLQCGERALAALNITATHTMCGSGDNTMTAMEEEYTHVGKTTDLSSCCSLDASNNPEDSSPSPVVEDNAPELKPDRSIMAVSPQSEVVAQASSPKPSATVNAAPCTPTRKLPCFSFRERRSPGKNSFHKPVRKSSGGLFGLVARKDKSQTHAENGSRLASEDNAFALPLVENTETHGGQVVQSSRDTKLKRSLSVPFQATTKGNPMAAMKRVHSHDRPSASTPHVTSQKSRSRRQVSALRATPLILQRLHQTQEDGRAVLEEKEEGGEGESFLLDHSTDVPLRTSSWCDDDDDDSCGGPQIMSYVAPRVEARTVVLVTTSSQTPSPPMAENDRSPMRFYGAGHKEFDEFEEMV